MYLKGINNDIIYLMIKKIGKKILDSNCTADNLKHIPGLNLLLKPY
jgi:hypothetical protein